VARGATDGFDNRWDRETPPPLAPGLSVTFPHNDWNNARGQYTSDFRAPSSVRAGRAANGSAATTAWDVAVSSPVNGPVTLSWDGLNGVSRTTRLTLVDKASGARVLLRDRSSYTFEARAGQTRAFVIEASADASRPLQIRDVLLLRSGNNRGVGGAGRSISYTLSDDAESVTVELQTLTGQTVRRAAPAARFSAGRQVVPLAAMIDPALPAVPQRTPRSPLLPDRTWSTSPRAAQAGQLPAKAGPCSFWTNL
jgi:hypothetical protein